MNYKEMWNTLKEEVAEELISTMNLFEARYQDDVERWFRFKTYCDICQLAFTVKKMTTMDETFAEKLLREEFADKAEHPISIHFPDQPNKNGRVYSEDTAMEAIDRVVNPDEKHDDIFDVWERSVGCKIVKEQEQDDGLNYYDRFHKMLDSISKNPTIESVQVACIDEDGKEVLVRCGENVKRCKVGDYTEMWDALDVIPLSDPIQRLKNSMDLTTALRITNVPSYTRRRWDTFKILIKNIRCDSETKTLYKIMRYIEDPKNMTRDNVHRQCKANREK